MREDESDSGDDVGREVGRGIWRGIRSFDLRWNSILSLIASVAQLAIDNSDAMTTTAVTIIPINAIVVMKVMLFFFRFGVVFLVPVRHVGNDY